MSCFMAQMGGNGTVDDSKCLAHKNRVTGEQKTEWKRYAKHPLAYGLMRQDFIN